MGPTGNPDWNRVVAGLKAHYAGPKVISVIVLEEGPRGLVLRESRVDVGSDVPGGGAA
jgi:hypothetical protein